MWTQAAAVPNNSLSMQSVAFDPTHPSIVYLSREVNGVFEVEAWSTPDGGASWTSRPLTAPSAQNNYRPISPRGQTTDDMDIVWMHGTYPSYQNFKTGLRTQIHTRDIVTPAAVAWAPRRLDVFARDGQSSALLQKYFSSGWSGWISFGVGPGGHPVGVRDGRANVPGGGQPFAQHRAQLAHGRAGGDPRLPPATTRAAPDGVRPGKLAERSGMSKQAMNQLLRSLEAMGYLVRRNETRGGRSRIVRFTQRGNAAYTRIIEILGEVERKRIEVINQQQHVRVSQSSDQRSPVCASRSACINARALSSDS